MEHILDETVPSEDLKKFEQKYHEELNQGKVVFDRIFLFVSLFVSGQFQLPVWVRLVLGPVQVPGRYKEGDNSSGGFVPGENFFVHA